MGFTYLKPSFFKSNGEIDRKAECDAVFLQDGLKKHYRVLKSAMRGSEYYAAIQTLEECVGVEQDGKEKWKPIANGPIWAAVFITMIDKHGHFGYKSISETEGPCHWKCPKSILKLLSDTDNRNAIEWRNKCKKVNGYR